MNIEHLILEFICYLGIVICLPAWHPSGKLIVIQAQKAHVPRYADNKCTPGAGALNDLWVIKLDDKRVWKIHSVRDEVSKDAAVILTNSLIDVFDIFRRFFHFENRNHRFPKAQFRNCGFR